MSASIKFTNHNTNRTVIRSFQANPKTGKVDSKIQVFEGDKSIYQDTFTPSTSSDSKLKTFARYAAKTGTAVAAGAAGLYAGAKIVGLGTAVGATLSAGAGGLALAAAGLGLYAAFQSESVVGTALASGVAVAATGALAAATGAGAESLSSAFEFAGQVANVLGVLGTVGIGVRMATAGWKLPDALSKVLKGKETPHPFTDLTIQALDGAAPEQLGASSSSK